MGSRDDIQAKIDKNTEIHIAKLEEEAANNKEKVFCCIVTIERRSVYNFCLIAGHQRIDRSRL